MCSFPCYLTLILKVILLYLAILYEYMSLPVSNECDIIEYLKKLHLGNDFLKSIGHIIDKLID